MNSYGLSDKGNFRPINEDCFCIAQNETALFAVVCDGIGGNKAGEVASALCCQYLKEEFEKAETWDETWLREAIERVNLKVYQDSQLNYEYQGMGTTMVCLLALQDQTYLANVGDSRGYCIYGHTLQQITKDHTMVNDLILKGFDEETACQLVGKNVISRAMGIIEEIPVDVFECPKDYDEILICSDGLHSYVESDQIEAVFASEKELEKQAQGLIDLANCSGGMDNTTVVVFRR